MLPAALGGVGQEQLNNNFPPQKNLGEAQAGGPRRSRSATLRGRQAASRWAGLPPAGRQLVGVLPEMSSDFF